MPINLYTIPGCSRKSLKLTCFFLFLPLFFFGQSLTGLWIGSVSNDSTTVRKDQSFEIALTEYKGKVYGYSRSEFIVDDVLYYIVKRVSGTIVGDVCEVIDDEIISYNFPKLLDKKVKVTSTFRRDKNDSTWYLAGKWKTNVTKKYYSVSGRVDLEEEKDLTASKIFPHLEELKLADAVVFYKERKEGQPIVKIAKPEKISSGISTNSLPLATNSDALTITEKPSFSKAKPSLTTNPVNATAAVNETDKKQTEDQSLKTTTAIEEPVIETELTAVKPADNTIRTETKNIPTTKVNAAPSANSVAVQPKSVTEDKSSTTETVRYNNTADVITTPVLEKKEEKIMATNSTVAKTNPSSNSEQAKANTTSAATTDKKATTSISKQDVAVTSKPVVKTDKPTTNTTTVAKNNSVTKTTATTPSSNEKKESLSVTKQEVASTTKPITQPVTPSTTTTEKKIVKTDGPPSPIIPEIKTPSIDITLKAAVIAGRKSEFSQQVNFKSDSLQVSLYDNGEIDGDTVSVFMNGEVIMAKQGLKSSAIRKTIYLTPGQEEFTLVLFAENLGKYPPNTGLLVVRDGDDVYNLRFSSDFEKNTGIVFRRKK